MLEDFETGGMKLPLEKRKELVALQKEIADLESKAEANINEDKTKMELPESALTGLPKDMLDKLPVK
jgi:Zn-dependent oligopeptidase